MISKKNIQYMILIFFLFIGTGLIHVALDKYDYTVCIMQLIYGSCVIMWAVSIEQRIIDKRVRYLLLLMAAFMLLYVVLQICKYSLFYADGLIPRYLWYAYYIPMTGMPLMLYFIALYMNLQEDEAPNRIWYWPIVPALLFVIGYLTNELHYQAFSFPPGALADDGSRKYGIISCLFWVFIGFLFLSSMGIILRKCRLSTTRKLMWAPLLPIAFGVFWLISESLGHGLKLYGISLFNIGEIFAFMVIGFVEVSVQIGMIPSNTGYIKLFKLTPVSAVIMDTKGRCNYSSEGTESMFMPNEDLQVHHAKVTGGSINWAVNISEINLLNRQLTELTDQIKTRNEYLKTQNSLQEEQSAVEARSRVYDQIAEIIKSQLYTIKSLVNDDFSQNLSQIAVYNAYIKRRSNLELIKENKKLLSLTELVTAIRESAEYLSLYGVETMVSMAGSNEFDTQLVGNEAVLYEFNAQKVIIAYEFFEYVVENMLPDLRQLSVIVAVKEQQFSLRMIINLKEPKTYENSMNWKSEELKKLGGRIELTSECTDMIIVLRFDKNTDSAESNTEQTKNGGADE